jgi:hypothetical protein
LKEEIDFLKGGGKGGEGEKKRGGFVYNARCLGKRWNGGTAGPNAVISRVKWCYEMARADWRRFMVSGGDSCIIPEVERFAKKLQQNSAGANEFLDKLPVTTCQF